MKKIIFRIFLTTLLFSGIQLYAKEKKLINPVEFNFEKREKENLRNIFKDVIETRKRMKEIERETIKNDPELKALAEEIITLRKKMREKLNEKLKDDQEYQNLKKKMEEIINEFKKRKEVIK